ncbi:MAG: hypothetical protein PF795_03160, partial [Kiritimatiellae bacterium]|nr:hypothetical protein [Kiritimatiellia bacterium]
MNDFHSSVILFSRDSNLCNRLQPLFEEQWELRMCDTYHEYSRLVDQNGPCVVLLDIRLPRDAPEVDALLHEYPDHVFIALGKPHSTPMRHPALSQMYAAMDLDTSPSLLAERVEQAQRHLQLLEENRFLKREVANAKNSPRPDPPRPDSRHMLSTRD